MQVLRQYWRERLKHLPQRVCGEAHRRRRGGVEVHCLKSGLKGTMLGDVLFSETGITDCGADGGKENKLFDFVMMVKEIDY